MRMCHFRETWGASSGNAAGEATAPPHSNAAFQLHKFLDFTGMSSASSASTSLSCGRGKWTIIVEGLSLSSQWLNWFGSLTSLVLSYQCVSGLWFWFIFHRSTHFWSCALPHDSYCLLDTFKGSKEESTAALAQIHFVSVYFVAFWRYKTFPWCHSGVFKWDKSSSGVSVSHFQICELM